MAFYDDREREPVFCESCHEEIPFPKSEKEWPDKVFVIILASGKKQHWHKTCYREAHPIKKMKYKDIGKGDIL